MMRPRIRRRLASHGCFSRWEISVPAGFFVRGFCLVYGLEDADISVVFTLFMLAFASFLVVRVIIYRREEDVARCLTLAERDFNNLISGGMSHGGRQERVQERRQWNEMAAIPAPTVLINNAGYRTPAHDLIQWNENDANGKGATMGKASMTAFLLRELYQGDVEGAQLKISADIRNGAAPYIAPGIGELVGFDKFDAETKSFPEGAGVERWLLRRVVAKRQKQIRMITTDADGNRMFRHPDDALDQLIQQNI
jgi:hypothetical protein